MSPDPTFFLYNKTRACRNLEFEKKFIAALGLEGFRINRSSQAGTILRVGQSLFLEKSESLFFLLKRAKKRAKVQFALFALFCSFWKERKSNSLFCALFKRAKERFALWHSFCKEWKSESLFVTLFKRATEKNRSFALFKKTEYLQKHQKVVNFSQFILNFLFKKSD